MAGQAQGSFVDPLLAARVGIAALGSGVVLDIWCVVFLSSKAGEGRQMGTELLFSDFGSKSPSKLGSDLEIQLNAIPR